MFAAQVPMKNPEAFNALGLAFDFVVAAATFPWDRNAPAWDFRVSIWSARLARKIIYAMCLKTSAPPQLSAVIEGVIPIVTFCLAQVVHYHDATSPDRVWGDGVLVGFSVGSSVFEVVGAVSATVGILAPPTLHTTALAVATCGACKGVIKTGTTILEHKLNYI